jgi:FkbM family methyltransferase
MKVALTRSPRLYSLARRPYATGRYVLRRPHESDFAAFALFEGDGQFLDVGANAGMSAFSFRIFKRRSPIVSIEPNPFHERDLRWAGRIVRRFEYRLWAAGSEDSTTTLHVPVFRGVPLTTEASLIPEEVSGSPSLRDRLGDRIDGPDFRIVAREVPVRRLDALGLDPAFVKLDVQGSEFDALLGLRETIARSRPVVMIEACGRDSYELLAEHGYDAYAYDRERHALVRPRGDEVNTFFRVP